MLPYLLGLSRPENKLVDSQKCFRSQDIEEVGDNRHTTFFEMLGNWSLGDYFKDEQQTWIWEFLTKELGLNPHRLYVSVFEGNDLVPPDTEAAENWKNLGVPADHIYYYGVTKNWWARSSYADMPVGEPGGPDSEIFYEFTQIKHDPKFGESCHPNCDCGRFLEICNNVFMTYQKTENGFALLKKKNIDFGGGLERITAATNNDQDIFNTDLFKPVIKQVEGISGKKYSEFPVEFRIIADHMKAAVFLINDGITPSNKAQGYVLRRLIRRAVIKMDELLSDSVETLVGVIDPIFQMYEDIYFVETDKEKIVSVISTEIFKFSQNLKKGIREVDRYFNSQKTSPGFVLATEDAIAKKAFDFYQSSGIPVDYIYERFNKEFGFVPKIGNFSFNKFVEKFEELKKKHQDLSRTSAAGMFKGGLADHSEVVTQYHTATHLLHQALRDVLGTSVHQAGSNLTGERLRFDFTYDKPLTSDEMKKVEDIINEKIAADLPVTTTTMTYNDAIKSGALAFFKEKYSDQVTVYTIGDYSRELCGGPHVGSTGKIGKIKIVKQESLGSSGRRLYLTKIS